MALIAGEISTTTYVDIPKVVRETIKEIDTQEQNMAMIMKQWQF